MYYYGARYYAAWIARFVSVDPLQHKYPELTPFQYASNNPVTMIDIDGMEGGKPEEKQLVQEQMERRDVTNIDSAKEPVVPELKDNLKNREQEMVQKVSSALNESMSAAGILQGGAESVAKSLDKNMLMGADNMLYLKNQDPRLKSIGDRALMTDDVTKLKSTGRNIRMTNELEETFKSMKKIGTIIDVSQISSSGIQALLSKGEEREAAQQNFMQNAISFAVGELNPALGVIVDVSSSIIESKEFKESKMNEYQSKMSEYKNTDSKKYENAKANYLKYNQLLNGNTNPEQKQFFFKQGK